MLKQVTILSTTSRNEHKAAERATEQVNQWLAEYDTVRVLSIRVAPVVHTHSREDGKGWDTFHTLFTTIEWYKGRG